MTKANAATDRGDYTTRAAAEYLGITMGYLHVMRHHKTGPACAKLDGRVYYTRDALDTWNADRKERVNARASKARAGVARRAASGPRGERKAGRKAAAR